VISVSVCLLVCLTARVSLKPHGHTSSFFCMDNVSVASLVLIFVRYDMLPTSGFVDDVLFSDNRCNCESSALLSSEMIAYQPKNYLINFPLNFAQRLRSSTHRSQILLSMISLFIFATCNFSFILSMCFYKKKTRQSSLQIFEIRTTAIDT